MLSPYIHTMLLFEFANEGRIPSSNTMSVSRSYKKRKRYPYHSSDAIPKSLQHRINALLLHPSDAVGRPVISKKSCSPLAWDTNLHSYCQPFLPFLPSSLTSTHTHTKYLPWQTSAYSREMFFLLMEWSPRGARPQPNSTYEYPLSISTNIETYHQVQRLCLRYGDIWFLGGTTNHLHNNCCKSSCCCTIIVSLMYLVWSQHLQGR